MSTLVSHGMTAFYSLSLSWQLLILGLIFTAAALLGATLTIMWQTQRDRQVVNDAARAQTTRLRERLDADIHRAIREARPFARTDWAADARRQRVKTLQGVK